MRLALILACLAMLGGCNVLLTREPLFTQVDEKGAPPLKPGVWAEAIKPDCQVDVNKPLADWPSCADGFVVLPGGQVGSYETHDGKPVWTTTPVVAAAGDPMVLQVRLVGDEAGVSGTAYAYAAARPEKLDEQNRIVEMTTWPVLCGPPPPDDAKKPDGTQRYGTLEPAAGLTMDENGDNCTTTSPDAARAAARASEGWTSPDGFTHDHWVRDGER